MNPEDAEARKAAKAKKASGQQGARRGRRPPRRPSPPRRPNRPSRASRPVSPSRARPPRPRNRWSPGIGEPPLGHQAAPGQRAYKRPERKPLRPGREIAPAPAGGDAPAQVRGQAHRTPARNTFFTPEEQKKYGGEPEPFMDATARLFASPEAPFPPAIRSRAITPGPAGGPGERRRARRGPSPAPSPPPAKAETPPARRPPPRAARARSGRKEEISAQAQPKPQQNQGTPAGQSPFHPPPMKRPTGRPPMRRLHFGAHKKDSTESRRAL